MIKRTIPAFGLTVIIIILMTTCGLTPLANQGMLLLKLSSEPLLTVKTIEPGLSMEPAYYDVYGTGPGAVFKQLGLREAATSQAALLPGEWTIYVEAFNENRTLIGSGTATVAVLAGAVSPVTVVIEPIPGDGQLDVTVTWPDGVLILPMVRGTLVPAGGSTDIGPVFETAEDQLSAQYLSPPIGSSEALPTGYYTLSLLLSTEAPGVEGRDTVWGAVEAVRIVNGQVSAKLFALEEDVNRGGVRVTIEHEFDNPFEVNILGVDPEVLAGAEIVATAEPTGADRYEWYLDGMPLDTGERIIFTDVPLGHHWLSVVVTRGSVMSSESVEFDVVREFSASSLWGVMVWGYDVWA
jgi:hypothetical protein